MTVDSSDLSENVVGESVVFIGGLSHKSAIVTQFVNWVLGPLSLRSIVRLMDVCES